MGPGKTLGRLEGQFARSSQAVSTLRKLKADGGQLNAEIPLSVMGPSVLGAILHVAQRQSKAITVLL